MIKIFKYDITYTIFIFFYNFIVIYTYVFISIFIMHVLYSCYIAYLVSFFFFFLNSILLSQKYTYKHAERILNSPIKISFVRFYSNYVLRSIIQHMQYISRSIFQLLQNKCIGNVSILPL